MKIPDKIKIGKHYYSIRKVRIVDWKNCAVVGFINYRDKKIKLKKFDDDHRMYESIFFHEMGHGILKELEYNHPKTVKFRQDEDFVQELGLMLRKTFLDLLKSQEVEK